MDQFNQVIQKSSKLIRVSLNCINLEILSILYGAWFCVNIYLMRPRARMVYTVNFNYHYGFHFLCIDFLKKKKNWCFFVNKKNAISNKAKTFCDILSPFSRTSFCIYKNQCLIFDRILKTSITNDQSGFFIYQVWLQFY